MIKNIILTSAIDNENYKGYVTLENTSEKILVSIKTYNLPKTGNKRVLGVLIDGELYKVTLNGEDSYIIDKKTDLNNKISVVLLEIQNMNSKILIWGSNETSRVWQNSITTNLQLESNNKEKNIENTKILETNEEDKVATNFIEKVYKESKDEDYETDEFIENLVTQNLMKEDCVEDYYSNFEEEKTKENLQENVTSNKSEFFASIESQIEQLLTTYEEEKALEEIIPNSKFVKVDLENNGNFYIFGVIHQNNDIKYIVYGLPGEYSVKPDDEYSKFYQWLPLNQENPEGYGYYLMYQDAENGNQIEMIIEEK